MGFHEQFFGPMVVRDLDRLRLTVADCFVHGLDRDAVVLGHLLRSKGVLATALVGGTIDRDARSFVPLMKSCL